MIQSNQFLKQAMHSDRKQSCLGVDRSDCKTKVEMYSLLLGLTYSWGWVWRNTLSGAPLSVWALQRTNTHYNGQQVIEFHGTTVEYVVYHWP